jgi:hypothetical protein
LHVIAVIEQAAVIEKILTRLNLDVQGSTSVAGGRMPKATNAHPPPRASARYDPADEAGLYWNPVTTPKSVH